MHQQQLIRCASEGVVIGMGLCAECVAFARYADGGTMPAEPKQDVERMSFEELTRALDARCSAIEKEPFGVELQKRREAREEKKRLDVKDDGIEEERGFVFGTPGCAGGCEEER